MFSLKSIAFAIVVLAMSLMMKPNSFVLYAIAIAVLALGLVMIKPEIVLHLPNGFILYAILGHPPPQFIFQDAWKDFDNWGKPRDLIVSGGVKCGTNWMLYMAHLIRIKANIEDFPFDEVNHMTPWPTLRHEPGQSWAQIYEKMNTVVFGDGKKLKDKWDHPGYPFRVFKSHELPADSDAGSKAVLPVRRRRDVKFLASVRNPFDQIRSFYPFPGVHRAFFRRMWGDFPIPFTDKKRAIAEFSEGGKLESMYSTWVATWFKYKDDPNVLVFHYGKMLKDPRSHVVRLAEFLGVELTAAEVDKVTHLSSFAEMKKIRDRFNYNLWAHSARPDEAILQSGKLLRSGKSGEGQAFFDEEDMSRIHKNIDKHWSPEVKAWMGMD